MTDDGDKTKPTPADYAELFNRMKKFAPVRTPHGPILESDDDDLIAEMFRWREDLAARKRLSVEPPDDTQKMTSMNILTSWMALVTHPVQFGYTLPTLVFAQRR